MEPEISEVATPHGPARVHLMRPADSVPTGLLMLGHGAGGGVGAGDLRIAADSALGLGCAVALVEQPYRVAGRRAPAPAAQADLAWTTVARHLSAGSFAGVPLVTGGRSFGARVACRTWEATGCAGVLCLAFPLHPPGRPEKSRQDELTGVGVPVLVVQGKRDPFGRPEGSRTCRVVLVEGDHALKKDLPGIASVVSAWLRVVLER